MDVLYKSDRFRIFKIIVSTFYELVKCYYGTFKGNAINEKKHVIKSL